MDKYTEDLINEFTNIINTLYFQGYIKDIYGEIRCTLQKIRILIEDTIKEKKEMSIKIDAYRYFIENRLDDISNMPEIISKYSRGSTIKEHYIDIMQPIFEALDHNYISKVKIKEKMEIIENECETCPYNHFFCEERKPLVNSTKYCLKLECYDVLKSLLEEGNNE